MRDVTDGLASSTHIYMSGFAEELTPYRHYICAISIYTYVYICMQPQGGSGTL